MKIIDIGKGVVEVGGHTFNCECDLRDMGIYDLMAVTSDSDGVTTLTKESATGIWDAIAAMEEGA